MFKTKKKEKSEKLPETFTATNVRRCVAHTTMLVKIVNNLCGFCTFCY